MNATEFIGYLENPSSMSESSTAQLEDLIEQFPYFQSARLLNLKGLRKYKSVEYPRALKLTAAYATDRKKLYELIMQEDLHKQIKLVEEFSGEKSTPDLKDISPLEAQILQEAVNASIKLEVSQVPEEVEETKQVTSVKKAPTQVPDKEQLAGDEPKTFNAWLRASSGYSSIKNMDEILSAGTTDTDQSGEDTPDKTVLIDKFIKATPKVGDIRKEKSKDGQEPFFSPMDTARLSLVDDPSFVTETLAGIYEAQGYIEKAKKAYELLGLKYPEKRDTFAARITKLEEGLKKG